MKTFAIVLLSICVLVLQCAAYTKVLSIHEQVKNSTIGCILKGQYSSVYFRVMKSDGTLDPSFKKNTHFFDEYEIAASTYVELNTHVGDPKVLARAVVERMLTWSTSRFVVLDVYNVSAWGDDVDQNSDFLEKFINVTEANRNYRCIVRTARANWVKIMGDNHKFGEHNRSLWYIHEDGSPDMSDFVKFGGWVKPRYKTYKSGVQECGLDATLASMR